MTAKPFRTELTVQHFDDEASALIRDLARRVDRGIRGPIPLDRYIDHPSELPLWEVARLVGRGGPATTSLSIVPYAWGPGRDARIELVRRLVERALTDAAAGGHAWTPVLDLLSFDPEWASLAVEGSLPSISEQLQPLAPWLATQSTAETAEELRKFEAHHIPRLVAAKARELSEGFLQELLAAQYTVEELVANEPLLADGSVTRALSKLIESWLASAAGEPGVRRYLREVALKEVIEKLGIPHDMRAKLFMARAGDGPKESIEGLLLADRWLDGDMLALLADTSNHGTRFGVAVHPNCPKTLLATILRADEANPSGSAHTLLVNLARHRPPVSLGGERIERAYKACSTDRSCAAVLLAHPDSTAAMWIHAIGAFSRRSKALILRTLARHPAARAHPEVRKALAKSRSYEVLMTLLQGSTGPEFGRHFRSLFRLFERSATRWLCANDPPEDAEFSPVLLMRLLEHPDQKVRRKAKRLTGTVRPRPQHSL